MGVFESEIITRHAASKEKRWLVILTLEQLWMRIIVVVGQKPLVIFHVTLDDDDNSVAKRRDFCAQFTHSFSHSYTPASRYTPKASLRNEDVLHRVPSATRYYVSFCHPRRLAKGANTLARILAAFAPYWRGSEVELCFRGTIERAARTSNPEIERET